MFVHAVYFWLKPGLSAEEIRRFEASVKTLVKIPTVVHGWVGTPAATSRPVIDSSYSFALVVAFHDLAGHDAYQAHPIHDVFREDCARLWREVKVYDSE